MAFDITIPFYAFRLRLHAGGSLLAPLTEADVLRVEQPLSTVAQRYAETFQEKVLNKGQISELLNEYYQGDFYQASLEVGFPPAEDGFSFPAFSLQFDYFFNNTPNGRLGVIPALGLEAFAEEPEWLPERLEQAVRMEFTSKRRLQAVQEIISAIWYSGVELLQHPIGLRAPTPRELEEAGTNNKDKLLPKAARLLDSKSADSCYGREEELAQLQQALQGSFHRSAVLVGPGGVGKSALAHEWVRSGMATARVWETTASTLIKELIQDTGWQDNLSQLCQEISADADILFIRNLMDLFEVGKYEGNSVSIAEYLRSYLSRGSIRLLAECTEEEYAQIEIQSPGYLSMFQRIELREPSEERLEKIILRKTNAIAQEQGIKIKASAVRESIRLSHRFTPYDGMPGRPIRFLENLLLHRTGEQAQKTVKRREAIGQFCEETGMPAFMVDPEVPMDPEQIARDFNEKVYGQEEAVERVTGILATVKAALARTGKPIASLLFVGPTGVGKTELAKQLARFMFGSSDRMTRFDMSEYSTPYAVQRLLGSRYNEGLLTSTIRKAPFGLLLFDEIEKADYSFYDLLLQVLSEGRLTDERGKVVNFCSNIIVMTSNVGAGSLNLNPIGWQQQMAATDVKSHFIREVQRYFRPELFNRIDQVVPFAPLDSLTIRYVVERELQLLHEREGLRYRRVHLQLEDEVYDYLAQKGYSPKYGARYLQRTLRDELVIPLAKSLNAEEPDDQLDLQVCVRDNRLQVSATADPLGLELLLEEWAKISHSDHASKLRRRAEQLREGQFFIKLLSELDLLTQRKKKEGDKFWKDYKAAEQYSYYLETREKIDALYDDIIRLERQFSCACLGSSTYEPAWVDELEEWERRMFDARVEIFARLHPAHNSGYLSVYGLKPEPVFEFYKELIGLVGPDTVECMAYFYREGYEPPEGPGYLEAELGAEELLLPDPPQEGDELCGFRFRLAGPAVRVYLEIESGIQRWILPPDAPRSYSVLVSAVEPPPPGNIHQADAFANKTARRTVQPGKIKDRVLKMSREYNRGQLPELIYQQLDDLFKLKLDRIT